MPSIYDLVTPNPNNLGYMMEQTSVRQGRATEDKDIATGRLRRDFKDYDLPGLANRFAARGTFHSGSARQSADRLRVGFEESSSDIDRAYTRTLDDIQRERLYARLGVRI